MKEKRILAFDWDGTILKSTEIGFKKVEDTLKALNLKCPPREFLKKHWGMEANELFKLLLKECGGNGYTFEELCVVHRNFEEAYPDIHYVEYIFYRLKKAGYKIALITNRSNGSWLKSCKLSNFNPKCFDFVQTKDHFHIKKPFGRVFGPLINYARRHDIKPEQIIYFGDTIAYDYQATLNCEPPIDFIGVCSGVNTKEEFIAAGLSPDRIIGSYEDVFVYLNNIIQQKRFAESAAASSLE